MGTTGQRAMSAAAVFLALSSTGCLNNPPFNPAELNFTWRKPVRSDLVGTWVPTSDSLSDLQKRGGYIISKHELTLREDGSFSLLNMPDWWLNDFGESRHGFDSGSGTWSLTQNGNWQVYLTFKKLRSWTAFGAPLNLRRQKSPYLIHIYVGDPDDWHAMLFERRR